MHEALTIALLVVAAGALYGTDLTNGHRRFAFLDTELRARVARVAGLAALVLALASWRQIEMGPGAFLIALTGMMVFGTLFSLLIPSLRLAPGATRHKRGLGRSVSSGARRSVEGASRLDLCARIVAATVGTAPVALCVSACLARFLPLSEDGRFAIGFACLVPLWVGLMCVTFLARRGLYALGACVTASLVLAGVVHYVPR
jgi:hypothetical protein